MLASEIILKNSIYLRSEIRTRRNVNPLEPEYEMPGDKKLVEEGIARQYSNLAMQSLTARGDESAVVADLSGITDPKKIASVQ